MERRQTNEKRYQLNHEYADQARAEKKKTYMGHLGGNVYCTVPEGSSCMDIRPFWKPKDKLVPTKKDCV